MKIYNTLTRQKEDFIPITPGEAKIYACGPTVYNFIHIGNARPIRVFDVLRRYMEYRGMKVTFVQNFTDIDDKIIRRANEEGSDYLTVSRKYIDEYRTDAQGLNVRPASVHPLATENIDEILSIVEDLVDVLMADSPRPSDALESVFLQDWNEATNDDERLRVVIDQVASLTDNSALALHSILC